MIASRRVVALAGVAVVAMVALRVPRSPAAAGAAVRPPSALAWRPCSQGVADCTRLRVPVDYAEPEGPTISLALTRVKARLPKQRIGTLFVNPGGPGAPGVEFAQLLGRILSPRVTERFDIIGFDPRGVASSAPIRCTDGPTLDRLQHIDPSPDDQREIDDLQSAARELAADCARTSPTMLPHVGTPDVARDIDQIRAALGETKISYLGFSYGTLLGLTYAQLFPTRLRAYVLDGVLDPAVSLDERNREQAIGFDRNLASFLADCAERITCPFHHGGNPRAAFDALMARVDASPLPVGKRSLGPAEFTAAIVSQLYNTQRGWPGLAHLLAAAERGNGRPALDRFDNYVDRRPNGTYDNTNEANLAVNCLDLPASRDPAHIVSEATKVAADAPVFGAAAVWYNAPCTYWAVASPGLDPRAPVGAPPVLLVGNTNDPATPYLWAQSVAQRVPESMLLTYAHDGHTAYLSGPPCIKNAIDAYLVTLTPVPASTVCR